LKGILNRLNSKYKFLTLRIVAPSILNALYFFVPRKQKTLLIIKNDGIGDYILFRNYLEFLKNSDKYKSHKIYLLGNTAFEDLAVYLDAKTIDGFFWYNDNYFLKLELVKLLFNLQRLRPQTIIYTNYSRKYPVDWLVKNIRADKKIGINGDTLNEPIELRNKANKYFDQLITLNNAPAHEFDRNKQIYEAITGEKCNLIKPVINKNELDVNYGNYIVVFPGASNNDKKWDILNFNKLCISITSKLNGRIILAGGKDDVNTAAKVKENISSANISDETGRLTLIQLCRLIGGAKLVITNDTVAVHIAATLDIPTVCIAKGDLYGRFIPYPKHIPAKIQIIFPPGFKPGNNNYYQWSSHHINEVPIADVYAAIESILTGSKININ
jgi:ADP-heptose:LPS heptosyltransferase